MSIKWRLVCGDILDVPADVLVCSANVYLTMSGGVGGAHLLRYGDQMQKVLRRRLDQLGVRHVPQGTLVETPPCGGPYVAVFHAVAVDALYASSAEIVGSVVRKSMERASELKARSLALPALATGYGRLSMSEFAHGLRRVMDEEFPPLETATLCLRQQSDAMEVRELLPSLEFVD